MEVQLSILHGHDANACIAVDGEIVAVLELERLLNQRHFHCPGPIEEFERFRRCWEGAIELLLAEAGNPPSIDLAVVLSRRPVSPILQEEQTWKWYQYGRSVESQNNYGEQTFRGLRGVVEDLVPVKRWQESNHHHSHAALGFFASPFRNALIVSFDGQGNDGFFNAYIGRRGRKEVTPLEELGLELGELYNYAGHFLPEVLSNTADPRVECELAVLSTEEIRQLDPSTECVDKIEVVRGFDGSQRCHDFACHMPIAGKLMGLAGTAPPNPMLVNLFKQYFRHGGPYAPNFSIPFVHDMYKLLGDRVATIASYDAESAAVATAAFDVTNVTRSHPMVGFEVQHVWAASLQHGFVQVVLEEIFQRLLPAAERILEAEGATLDGVVISGGCALNVPANFAVAEALVARARARARAADDDSNNGSSNNSHDPGPATTSRRPPRVFVPSAPDDSGLSVGALWAAGAVPRRPPVDTLRYAGFPLWDLFQLPEEVLARGARRATVDDVARRLVAGQIVGVARGRAEFGPRALGHRSLLAAATDRAMLARLNRLKRRQWYRPVAPMIAREDAARCFGPLWAELPRDAAATHCEKEACLSSPEEWEEAEEYQGHGLCYDGPVVESPHMSLAGKLTPWCAATFPAIRHFDGTARPQTVTAASEPWLHALLGKVRSLTGTAGVLINTSFNSRGKPILNTIEEALELLDEDGSELDAVLIEDWLFERGGKAKAASEEAGIGIAGGVSSVGLKLK